MTPQMKLGPNRYGKAETRVVAVREHEQRHEIADLNVSIALSGEMTDVHLTGDNQTVLPTDTQKNTVFAFARRHGVDEIEDFALLLARHFVESQPSIRHARVAVDEYGWERNGDSPHSFLRKSSEVRTCVVHHDGTNSWVVSGLKDLVLLNTTNSEFRGYVHDEFTTLPETDDRVLATAVQARWRHTTSHTDWRMSYERARTHLLEAYAETYSKSLQQTLYAMGCRILQNRSELCEVTFSLPNNHHFAVDLSPFGMDNDNVVFFAADRPYGLIEGTVVRDDAPAPGPAWE